MNVRSVFSAETVLFVVGGLGLLLTLPAMGVAWAHLALRASTVEDRFFLVLFTKSLTTWLAVLVTGVLAVAPAVVLFGAHYLRGPAVLWQIAFQSLSFASALLLNVFIVLFYLDLSARHAGADLEATLRAPLSAGAE